MKLTEKERDWLVDTLIESLWQFPLENTHRSVREMIVHKAIMPNVECILAERAVPEPDNDAVDRATVALSDSWNRQFSDDGGVSFRQLATDAIQAAAIPEPDADAVERFITAFDEFGERNAWTVLSIPNDPNVAELDRQQVKYALEAAAVPTVPDAAGDDLDADMTLAYMKGWQDGQDAMRNGMDAMLDSVHPSAIIRSVWELRGGGWEARISVPEGPDDNGWYDYTGNESVGTGATRMEAIINAVENAKEANHEHY